MKTKLILALIFAAVVAFGGFIINLQRNEIKSLRSDNSVLMGNNNLLVTQLRKTYNDNEKLATSNKKLQQSIKADTSGFDWHFDLTSNPVLLEFKRMHKN